MLSEIIRDPLKGDIAEFRFTREIDTGNKLIPMLVYDSTDYEQAIILVSQKIPPEFEIASVNVLIQGKFSNVTIRLRLREFAKAVA